MDKVSVAGILNGFNKIQRGVVQVATRMNISHIKSIVTTVFGGYGNDFFLEADKCHHGLKGGARRILGHQGPVEKGIQCI